MATCVGDAWQPDARFSPRPGNISRPVPMARREKGRNAVPPGGNERRPCWRPFCSKALWEVAFSGHPNRRDTMANRTVPARRESDESPSVPMLNAGGGMPMIVGMRDLGDGLAR